MIPISREIRISAGFSRQAQYMVVKIKKLTMIPPLQYV